MLEIKLTIGADSELINAVNRLADAFSNAKVASSKLDDALAEMNHSANSEVDEAPENSVTERRKRRTKAEIEATRQAEQVQEKEPVQEEGPVQEEKPGLDFEKLKLLVASKGGEALQIANAYAKERGYTSLRKMCEDGVTEDLYNQVKAM